MEIEGKRIVITGAASGIGKALLYDFANQKTNILAVDKDGQRLAEHAGRLKSQGGKIECLVGDLSQTVVVDDIFILAEKKMGGIDIYIANAGRPYYEKTDQADWKHIADIFEVNVVSVFYSFMKMRHFAQGHDFRFVMVSSAMAHMAMPGYALYSSTKAALLRFAEAARLELEKPHQLMMVYPIATRTRFFEAASNDTPLPWPSQSAEDVAKAVIRGIRRDKKAVYPSHIFSLILFLDRVQPVIRNLYQRYYLKDLRKIKSPNKENY